MAIDFAHLPDVWRRLARQPGSMALASAITLITLALIAYTTGILLERKRGVLRWSHIVWFGVGLVCDASGTYLMSSIATGGGTGQVGLAAVLNQLMAVTGAAALVLMAAHLTWAVVVMIRNRDAEKHQFHRFSLGVWLIWLFPYFAGGAAAMLG